MTAGVQAYWMGLVINAVVVVVVAIVVVADFVATGVASSQLITTKIVVRVDW